MFFLTSFFLEKYNFMQLERQNGFFFIHFASRNDFQNASNYIFSRKPEKNPRFHQ